MTRTIIAAVAGAVTLYIWGMASWMVFGIHDGTLHELRGEENVIDVLEAWEMPTGTYVAPFPPEDTGDAEALKEFTRRHQAGPLVTIVYTKEGSDPMPPSMMVNGFVLDLTATAISAYLLTLTLVGRPSYAKRVLVVFLMGLLSAAISYMALWNWMLFPFDFIGAMVLDVAIGWLLCGCVQAAFVKPPAMDET